MMWTSGGFQSTELFFPSSPCSPVSAVHSSKWFSVCQCVAERVHHKRVVRGYICSTVLSNLSFSLPLSFLQLVYSASGLKCTYNNIQILYMASDLYAESVYYIIVVWKKLLLLGENRKITTSLCVNTYYNEGEKISYLKYKKGQGQ